VPGKAELLELMVDRVAGSRSLPTTDAGWRAGLHDLATSDLAALRAHPWLLQVATPRTVFGPNVITRYDAALALLEGHGLAAIDVVQGVAAVESYARGAAAAVIEAEQAPVRTGSSDDEWWERRAPLLDERMDGRFPRLVALGEAGAFAVSTSTLPYTLQRALDRFDLVPTPSPIGSQRPAGEPRMSTRDARCAKTRRSADGAVHRPGSVAAALLREIELQPPVALSRHTADDGPAAHGVHGSARRKEAGVAVLRRRRHPARAVVQLAEGATRPHDHLAEVGALDHLAVGQVRGGADDDEVHVVDHRHSRSRGRHRRAAVGDHGSGGRRRPGRLGTCDRRTRRARSSSEQREHRERTDTPQWSAAPPRGPYRSGVHGTGTGTGVRASSSESSSALRMRPAAATFS
jgi:hypothetical protein